MPAKTNGTLKSAEEQARQILRDWTDASREKAPTPGASWQMTVADSEMISRIASAFQVFPGVGEALATSSTMAWARMSVDATLAFAGDGLRTEAFAQTTQAAGESLIDHYRRRSPLP